ncbi:MAG TPA: hypothetical protein VHS99_21615 [Chloroflexota bacterium]|nr:hypothetical protein [Chloroflexota bacterium]
MIRRPVIVRDADSWSYLESFLIWTVVAVLGIRGYLHLTGYPQLGGGGLHIAHMLWGGLLLMVALVLVLTFIGKWTKHWAALIGGLGFGTFIDELGKFITADNNYFFRPTIALIYVLVISLFLLFRYLSWGRVLSAHERLVNAADTVTEVLLDGASPEEVAKAQAMLEGSGMQGAVPEALRAVVAGAASAPAQGMNPAARVAAWGRRLYTWLIAWTLFQRLLVAILVLNAVLDLVLVAALLILVYAIGAGALPQDEVDRFWAELEVPLLQWPLLGSTVASVVSAGCTIIGAVHLPRSRYRGLIWFRRAQRVSIFFTQVFLFLDSELAALQGLAIDVFLLLGINYLLHQERTAALQRASLARQPSAPVEQAEQAAGVPAGGRRGVRPAEE